MNVRDNDLAGDSLGAEGSNFTANLSDGAEVNAQSGLDVNETYNLSQNSTLTLAAAFGGKHTVNISGNDTATLICGHVSPSIWKKALG
jgi:hypothetical protein